MRNFHNLNYEHDFPINIKIYENFVVEEKEREKIYRVMLLTFDAPQHRKCPARRT
jgi:hypothetical protein